MSGAADGETTRLLYVGAARIPGPRAHSIQIVRACAAFAAEGVDVELWMPTRRDLPSEPPTAEEVRNYYGVDPRFVMRRLPSLDFIDLLPPAVQRPAFLLHSWSFARAVRREARTHPNFDYVYLRDPYALFWWLRLRGAPPDAPLVVYEAHGEPRRRRARRRLRRALRGASAVIALNPHLAERMADYGVDPRRIAAIPADAPGPPSDLDQAQARRQLGINAEQRVICYAGSLTAAKGVATLIEAARRLPQDHLLLLVGGDAREQAWARGLIGDDARIRLEPRATPAATARYLAAADVLAAPNSARDPASAEWTSPMKLFEYHQADRVIVLSDVEALRAAVAELPAEEPRTVVWCAPDDPSASAQALERALKLAADRRSQSDGAARRSKGDGRRRRARRILDHLQHVKNLL